MPVKKTLLGEKGEREIAKEIQEGKLSSVDRTCLMHAMPRPAAVPVKESDEARNARKRKAQEKEEAGGGTLEEKAYGKIKSKDGSIFYGGYIEDEKLKYHIDGDTVFTGINPPDNLNIGDTISIVYYNFDGNHIAKRVTLLKRRAR